MKRVAASKVFVLQGSFDQKTGQGLYTERVLAQLNMPVTRIALAGARDRQSVLRRALHGILVVIKLAFAIRSNDRVYWIISRSRAALFREMLLALLLRRHASRVVVHLHGNELHETIMEVPGWVRHPLRSSLSKFTLIVLCRCVAENLAAVGLDGKVKVVGNTIDDASVVIHVDRPAVLPSSKVTLLFLSNLLPEKGILDAIDTVEALNEMRFLGRQWTLNVAGGWSGVAQADRDQITQRMKASAAVTYWGFANPDAKRVLFSHSDIFVFPSRYRTEAFPLALIEALLAGLPIITSPVGCIPEMIAESPHVATLEPGQGLQDALTAFAERIAAQAIRINNGSAFCMAGDFGPRTVAGIIECQN